MNTYKRFLTWFAVLVAGLLLAVATVCYVADPANLFSGGRYEKKVAGFLLSGQNVVNVGNCDERLLQKMVIEGMPQTPAVVAIGSSRSMQIGGELFPAAAFHNSSVSGASLEDVAALIFLYEKKGFPEKMVLGIDPWMFNRNNGQTRWSTLSFEYFSFMAQTGLREEASQHRSASKLKKVGQLFSLAYFSDSVKRLFSNNKNELHGVSAFDAGMTRGLHVDGSRFEPKDSAVTPEILADRARQYATERPVYGLADFTRLDQNYKKTFEAIVSLLNRSRVEVILFLSPYHPEACRILSLTDEGRLISEVEQYVRAFAAARGIVIVGSYDPAIAGIGYNDFIDGMHPTREGVVKCFKHEGVME